MFDEYIKMYDPKAPLTIMYDVIQSVQSKLMTLIVDNAEISPKYLNIGNDYLGNLDDIVHIVRDSRYPYIIVPVGIERHYLIMIFNRRMKTFNIYDPSYDHTNARGLISTISMIVSDRTGYVYDVIPYFMDFQHRTNDFFCSLWSMMVAVVSVNNHTQVSKVVHILNTYDRHTLTKVIGGFIIFAYNTVLDHGLDIISYNVTMAKRYLKDVSLLDISTNIDPERYLRSLNWDIVEIPVRHLKLLYIAAPHILLRDDILELQYPMTSSEFRVMAESLYLGKYDSYPLIWTTGYSMDSIFTTTYELLEAVRPISRMIAAGNVPTDKDLEKVKEVFSYSYDIYTNPKYKIWEFVFEFYVRYLLLDTYDIPGCRTIMDSREKKYNDLMNRYNISSTSVFFLCMFPPAHYVDLEKFLKTVSTNTNSKEHIIDSFLQSCLQRSERLDRTHRKRLEAILSAI